MCVPSPARHGPSAQASGTTTPELPRIAEWLAAAGSAPSAGRLKPYRYEGGKSAKPAVDLPSNVCNFRLAEVRNFRSTLTYT